MTYLSLEDAAKLGAKEQFFQNVRRTVIPELVKSKKLSGKTVEGNLQVLDDEAFRRTMRFGIERFVYGQEAWSFVAIRAPLEDVAKSLKARPDVRAYEVNVAVGDLEEGAGVQPDPANRHAFLVKHKDSAWPLLIQTVNWIESSDMVIAVLLAADLSAALKTTAVAVWDDDFAGSTAVVCEKGEKKQVLDDESEGAGFYGFFYENEIAMPECFISTDGSNAQLFVADPGEIERADHVVIAIPDETQASGPHVAYKLEMMNESLAEGLDDEEAFRAHAVEGLWQRVQAMRASRG